MRTISTASSSGTASWTRGRARGGRGRTAAVTAPSGRSPAARDPPQHPGRRAARPGDRAAIGEQHPRRRAPRVARDPAAGMGGGPGQVEPREAGDPVAGQGRRRPEGEHAGQAHLHVHDVATGERQFALQLERRLYVQPLYRVGEARREAVHGRDQPLRLGVGQHVPVRAVGERVRVPLAPDRDDVLPGWGERVVARREAHGERNRGPRQPAGPPVAVRGREVGPVGAEQLQAVRRLVEGNAG